MNKRLGFEAALDFTRWPPEKIVQVLAEAGYGAVAWTLAHFNPRTKSRSELEFLAEMTRNSGLQISEVIVQQDLLTTDDYLRKDRAKLIEECLLAAADVGVKILNVFSGPVPWDPAATRIPEDISEGRAWDLLVSAYEPLVKLAERRQIQLALEPVFRMLCHDYYSTQELFRRLDSPWLGINLDPSHLMLYRNDVPWVIRQWAGRIKHVHLKDVIGRVGVPEQDFMFPLLGEGIVPWDDIFDALEAVGYAWFMSIEFESFRYYSRVLGNNPAEAARLAMTQFERLSARRGGQVYDHASVLGLAPTKPAHPNRSEFRFPETNHD